MSHDLPHHQRWLGRLLTLLGTILSAAGSFTSFENNPAPTTELTYQRPSDRRRPPAAEEVQSTVQNLPLTEENINYWGHILQRDYLDEHSHSEITFEEPELTTQEQGLDTDDWISEGYEEQIFDDYLPASYRPSEQ